MYTKCWRTQAAFWTVDGVVCTTAVSLCFAQIIVHPCSDCTAMRAMRRVRQEVYDVCYMLKTVRGVGHENCGVLDLMWCVKRCKVIMTTVVLLSCVICHLMRSCISEALVTQSAKTPVSNARHTCEGCKTSRHGHSASPVCSVSSCKVEVRFGMHHRRRRIKVHQLQHSSHW